MAEVLDSSVNSAETGAIAPGDRRIRSIAIVGGGTAGWLAASILARALPGSGCRITCIESPDIPTIGVGEATIPPIIDLLRFLSINEADFVQHTQATYKLGIRFTGWTRAGERYWHPFGTFGQSINLRPFHHAWQRARSAGLAPQFNDYSLAATLGESARFRFPDPRSAGPVAGLRYALHFDAALVARYLRSYSEKLGVQRLEGTVEAATQRADGLLDELVFKDGTRVGADLFIDCSGFRGLLIEQTLKSGYLDWSSLLPCDRAVAMQSRLASPRAPFTEAIAQSAGWRWRIPLQQRAGNGYVYSSAHVSDEQALETLLKGVAEQPLTDPRVLRFVTGRRKLFWNRNCVALGLASGFLEPLESTSIHLVVSGLYKLLEHFPDRDFVQPNIDSYNEELIAEMDRIRDFLVLHYCLNSREDAPLWAYCRSMALPDSLAERIELYRATGRIRTRPGELFTDLSWFYIFEGLGVRPERHDPLMDVVSTEQLREILATMARATAAGARNAPLHDSYFAAPGPSAAGAR
jgi:tryptophan 7-halogenase